VLLDFSAVWCPPCNVLAAEILEGDPGALEGFEWAVVDVDHPSSWEMKDRYAVGGYPTLIVASADGSERARLVGYPGKEDFLAWLSTSTDRTDGSDLARDPATVDPERAAELAWRLVERGDAAIATPWLERAAAATESVELHLARAAVSHDPAEVRWVRDHAPARLPELLPALPSVAERDRPLAQEIAAEVVLRARGQPLSYALSIAAEIEPDPERKEMLFAASAAVLAGELTGDPAHDRGFVTDLAELEDAAGDREGALRRLETYAGHFPDVPTFHFYAARIWLRGGDAEEALAAAERAFALSWGDNRLRAAIVRSKALAALGRDEEAAARAREALVEQPPPPDDLAVRTNRYRAELETLAVAP
jgi:tetratricopeptide (TPR) repeat protein